MRRSNWPQQPEDSAPELVDLVEEKAMRAHAWISHKLNAQQNHVQIQSTEITMLSVLETDSLGKQCCMLGRHNIPAVATTSSGR